MPTVGDHDDERPTGPVADRLDPQHLGATGLASLVIDCETGKFRMGLAHQLADHLMAEYVPLGEVSASALTDVVRSGLHETGAA